MRQLDGGRPPSTASDAHVPAPRAPLRRGALTLRALVIADVLGLLVAALTVERLYPGGGAGNRLGTSVEFIVFLATLPLWLIAAKLFMLYDRDDECADHSTVDDLVRVFLLITVGAWMLSAGASLSHAVEPGTAKLITFWALAIVLVTTARSAARFVVRRHPAYLQRAIVVGAGETGQLVARKLLQHGEYGIEMVGFVDSHPRAMRPGLAAVPVLGGFGEVLEIAHGQNVERVIVAFPDHPHDEMLDAVAQLRSLNIQVDIVPYLFESIGTHVRLHAVEGLPLIALPAAKRFPLSRSIKRAMDVVMASVGLLVVLPVAPYVIWRIKRDSPGPVLFRQTRLGLHMREFTVYKLRTMRTDTDPAAHRAFIAASMQPDAAPAENGLFKLDQADSVTPFGRFLRRTSLDEVPQLINVLKGDMSLVGPRPCLRYETEQFLPHHFERFSVRPGITGLWQVTARAHATFREAVDLDVAYARGWSLLLDAWLLCRTPLHMLRRGNTV